MLRQLSSYAVLILTIGGMSTAKNLCQKISDGEEDDTVPLEAVNQCYECGGWNEVDEGHGFSLSLPNDRIDVEDSEGWSWCATDVEDDFEISFDRPIKLAGFTLKSAANDMWVKSLQIFYGNGSEDTSEAKTKADGETVFPGNVDDYTMTENQFMVPITTTFVRVKVVSYELWPCFTIHFYSCDEKWSSSPYPVENDNLLSDIMFLESAVGMLDECTVNVKKDCGNLKCFAYLKDSFGCDRCACDPSFTGTIEGDIVIDSVSRGMAEEAYGVRKDPYNLMRGGLKGNRNRWNDYRSGNNYVVPFILEASLTSAARRVIPLAIQDIEKVTCLRFRQRSSQEYYLRFFRGGGCYSYVGNIRRRGGQQISIGSGCEHKGIVIHEILHALGFWHEQSRSDRDQYVTIFYQNIQAGRENNFEKRDTEDFGSPYDYQSVMHYGNKAFSSNGRDTIQAKRQPNLSLGQRNGLTSEDTKQVNRMYQCSGTSVTTTPPTTETTTTTCRNLISDRTCNSWQRLGYCEIRYFQRFLEKYCAKACGKCGNLDACTDFSRKCPQRRRHCNSRSEKRRERMQARCPKTCDSCF